jgi:hypothetical protein
MNRSSNDCILIEKTMNQLPTTNASLPLPRLSINGDSSVLNAYMLNKILPIDQSCSDFNDNHVQSWHNQLFITPRQFADIIQDTISKMSCRSVPIVDCRSSIEFSCQHIRWSCNVNCYTKIIAKKLTSKRLEDIEPSLLSAFHNFDMVILYDESTDASDEEQIRSLPIYLAVKAAKKSNKQVHIIKGTHRLFSTDVNMSIYCLGGLNAVKSEHPYLIEIRSDVSNDDNHLLSITSTPNVVGKENIRMTEIIPHIFVGG